MDKNNFYTNFTKPLKNNKNTIWYDSEKGINKLKELAGLIGLQDFIVIKDNDDNAVVKSVDGKELEIVNCQLQLIFLPHTQQYITKDWNGKKTFYNTDEVIIWQ